MKCIKCGADIPLDANFCPKCGASLKVLPKNTSIGKQIVIYLVSFFLAPFGLGYAFSYIADKDPKAKVIGYVSLALTVFAVLVSFLLVKKMMEAQYSQVLGL